LKVPSILPPPDLLRQVEGVESGLRKNQRLGSLGWLGVVAATVQAIVVVIQSDYWNTLVSFKWDDLLYGVGGRPGLLDKLPFLVALGILLGSIFLIVWRRYWLKESQEPFRYTFAVDDFNAVTREDPSFVWLRHHLSERLNDRIGRLSLLEEASQPSAQPVEEKGTDQKRGAPAPRYESHVHIGGHYGIRVDTKDRWIVEVVPRVRVGPHGSAETLAHSVTFPLNPAFTGSGERRRATEPANLSPEEYEKLLERVYFSLATEIYKQIGRDVQHKIDLLPTNYLRATAYLHEARDYAKSNTLVAFDEAERLYEAAMMRYDPSKRAWPTSWIRWPGQLLRRLGGWLRLLVRVPGAYVLKRLARSDLRLARAEIGYANVLLDRRTLALLSGHRINPIFECRPITERAVRSLKRVPRDVDGAPECLFDAHVSLALAWAALGSGRKARGELENARRLLPSRATEDARFAFAEGNIETRPRSRQLRFQRAAELDPKFEAAQFALAIESELLWRTRPQLEDDVADTIVEEYERVLTLDPGNIGAWANVGYMQWLLAEDSEPDRARSGAIAANAWRTKRLDGGRVSKEERLKRARRYFERGREYKAIKRETFVAEIDYGLARIAAEMGRLGEAYSYFTSALTAHMAQSTSQGYIDSWSSSSDYFFRRMDLPMLKRFRAYRRSVERFHGDPQHAPDVPPRVRDSVLAFVVNDWGEACYNYFKRSADGRYLIRARRAYKRSAQLDPTYAIPRHNLFLLNKEEDSRQAEEDAENLFAVEPDWFEAKLAIMWKRAQEAAQSQREADENRWQRVQSLRQAGDISRQATVEETRASFFEPARAEEESDESKTYVATEEAQSKATEAGRLARDAAELNVKRKALLQAADHHREKALRVLRELLPHEWLWRGTLERLLRGRPRWLWRARPATLTPERILMSRAKAWTRWRLAREWRWEREFNDIHVRALLEWGQALLSPGERRLSPSDKIFAHVEEHFWQDNLDIMRYFRERTEWKIRNIVDGVRVPLSTVRALAGSSVPLPGTQSALRTAVGRLTGVGPEFLDVSLPYIQRFSFRNVQYQYQDRINKYNRILAGAMLAQLDDDPAAFSALYWLGDGHYTVARGRDARVTVWYTTLDSGHRQRFLRSVLEHHTSRSPALYRWVGDQFQRLLEETRVRREMGSTLREFAAAIENRDQAHTVEIMARLESRDWGGFDSSALGDYRRGLTTAQPDLLLRLGERLNPSAQDSALGSTQEESLRQSAVESYVAALESDDPDVLWSLVAPLRALGEPNLSQKALRSFSAAIGPSSDPNALWSLAQAYKELEDWPHARKSFHRALEADDTQAASHHGDRVRHNDLYHWEIARALWGEQRYVEAMEELGLVTGQAREWTEILPGESDPKSWDGKGPWTAFVRQLVERRAILSLEAYRILRTTLERWQRGPNPAGSDRGRRDSGYAVLWLARARRTGGLSWSVPDRLGSLSETLPVVTPILLEADSAVLPDSEAPIVKKMIDRHIPDIRARIEEEQGIRIPGVRLRGSDRAELAGRHFVVMLHEVPLASGTVTEGHPEKQLGPEGIEPVTRRYLDTFLGFQELYGLLEQWAATSLDEDAAEILRSVLPTGRARLRFLQVLQRLAREAVPVNNLGEILKASDALSSPQEVDEIVEHVRKALRSELPGNDSKRPVVSLGGAWEGRLEQWIQARHGKRFLAVPVMEEPAVAELLAMIAEHLSREPDSILVVSADLRRFVRRLIAAQFPSLPVLAETEWLGEGRRQEQQAAPVVTERDATERTPS
jgi:hypothetical protein